MSTTTTTTTTTVDPATCKVADLKIEATRLSVPNRSKMTTPELRVAVAAEQAKWAELDAVQNGDAVVGEIDTTEVAQAVDLSGDALDLAAGGVLIPGFNTPTADQLAAEQAQHEFEATATPGEIEAQIDAAVAQHAIDTCVQAALHTGVGTCACGWSATAEDAMLAEGVVPGVTTEFAVTQRTGDTPAETPAEEFARLTSLPLVEQAQKRIAKRIRVLANLPENCGPREDAVQDEDEATDAPAAAGVQGTVLTHTKTRGAIDTKAFRDVTGKRPSAMGKRAWSFREAGGEVRTFEDTTYRAAAATLVMQAAGTSKWTLLS